MEEDEMEECTPPTAFRFGSGDYPMPAGYNPGDDGGGVVRIFDPHIQTDDPDEQRNVYHP